MKSDILGIFILIATLINVVLFFAIAVPALGVYDSGEDDEEPEDPSPEFNSTEVSTRVLRRVTDADEPPQKYCSRHYSCEP